MKKTFREWVNEPKTQRIKRAYKNMLKGKSPIHNHQFPQNYDHPQGKRWCTLYGEWR